MSTPRNGSYLATLAILFATLVWGSTFVVVQDGINAMPMMMFMGWRFAVATLVLIALRPQALKMSAETFRKGLFIGIALALGYWTQTFGLYSTSASVSGFITGMFVVLTPVAALLVYRLKIGGAGWVAIALAFAGVGLISVKMDQGIALGGGEAWTLLGAAFFSFQIMWLSHWGKPETSYSFAIMQIGTCAVFFMGVGIPVDGWQVPQSADLWKSILFLAVFASAFAFIAQSWAQSHMTPTRAAVLLSTEPLFAGVFGIWAKPEDNHLTLQIGLGAAAILAAMLLIELAPRKSEAVADLATPHQGV